MQPSSGRIHPFATFLEMSSSGASSGMGLPGQGPMKTHALGSGFVIDDDGLILTNNHVVEKADEIKIKTDAGKDYDAKVVARDPKTDIALIKVTPGADFPKPARLGNSSAMRVVIGLWLPVIPLAWETRSRRGSSARKGASLAPGLMMISSRRMRRSTRQQRRSALQYGWRSGWR